MKFDEIPYTKVKEIQYSTAVMETSYKLSFTDAEFKTVNISKRKQSALSEVKPLKVSHKIAMEKKKDVRSMYKYMPKVDQIFMEAIFGKETNGDDEESIPSTVTAADVEVGSSFESRQN